VPESLSAVGMILMRHLGLRLVPRAQTQIKEPSVTEESQELTTWRIGLIVEFYSVNETNLSVDGNIIAWELNCHCNLKKKITRRVDWMKSF